MKTALKSRNNFVSYFESFKRVFFKKKIRKWYTIDSDFAFTIMINLENGKFGYMHMYKMNGLGPQEIFSTVIILSPYKSKETC